MSAALKATSVLGGLAIFSVAATYTFKTSSQEFSRNALATAEHVAESVAAPAAPRRLPSNFFHFSLGDFKISNARA